jgi:alternate F1F0 ATPase F1 subunit gamma
MSESAVSLRRQIHSAGDLQSVVRTMKALAASSIGQYEKSVHALGDYYRAVELGLAASLKASKPEAFAVERKGMPDAGDIGAIVFGSDQGLVGQFNDMIADYAIQTLSQFPRSIQNLGGGRARSDPIGKCRCADHGNLFRAELGQSDCPAGQSDPGGMRGKSSRG